MDEILSSIRQIIADDDASGAERKPYVAPIPTAAPYPRMSAPEPDTRPSDRPFPAMASAPSRPADMRNEEAGPVSSPASEASRPVPQLPSYLTANPGPQSGSASRGEETTPLALSPEQILDGDEPEGPEAVLEAADESYGAAAELVDPEDIAFAGEEDEARSAMGRTSAAPTAGSRPVQASGPAGRPYERPQVSQLSSSTVPPAPSRVNAPRTSTMPDPTLSQEMADRLIGPATDAAVQQTFARLSSQSPVGQGVTVESMMREMLRPMLKEWLDENLPSVVERMVEREIARISRGGN
ncbi:PopZ family protein [Arsenicitalea aurantiaca]|nr:DUF2497 domain-containing protein [Arsenicitalea aurantiaca]